MRRMTKRLGEMGEAAFLAKAAFMGMEVSRPWGDSNRYDLIIDVGGRLFACSAEVCAPRLRATRWRLSRQGEPSSTRSLWQRRN